MFITFEGGEGSGKTTQIQKLAEVLRAAGHSVLTTREPGGTALGREIRRILLDGNNTAIHPTTELLLYAADRAQHVQELVRPALGRNEIVLSDRYADATVVYQGFGRGLDTATLQSLNEMATGGLWPDLTILLDIDPRVGLARSHARLSQENSGEDRFEKEALQFHQNVRQGYLRLAQEHPKRFFVLDATLSVEALHQEILRIVKTKL
jgi:thymidylate kinase